MRRHLHLDQYRTGLQLEQIVVHFFSLKLHVYSEEHMVSVE